MLATNPLSFILESDLGLCLGFWLATCRGLNPGPETLGSQEHCRALAPREWWVLKGSPFCCQEPGCSSWGRRPLPIAVASSSGKGHGEAPQLRLCCSAVLCMQPGVTLSASLLAGGYERFSSEYPEFCAKTKSLSNVSPPTSAEPLDLGCSSCGTPLHDQVCLEAPCLASLTASSSTAAWSCWSLSALPQLRPAEPKPCSLSSHGRAWWSS